MKKITTVFVFLALVYNVLAQNVGVGTTTPDGSAALEIKSNNKGLLIPVMTSANRNAIATPAKGLMVYDSSAKAFFYHTGTAWKSFGSANIVADADGNTKIEVERTANDDIVRITTGGTDHTWFQKNNTGAYPLLNFPANGAGNFLLGTQSGWNLKPTILANTFIGINAGYTDSLGDYNTFVGESSGYYATGSRSVNIGARAGYNTGNGNHNVNIGMEAGWGATNTNNAIHIGSFSGLYDSATKNTIAIGRNALTNNKANGNIAIGTAALANNVSINYQIAIGDSALYHFNYSNFISSAYSNIAIGSKALFNNTSGLGNIAIGRNALTNNTFGSENTALGEYALSRNIFGNQNTAVGYSALRSNLGSGNTALGRIALSVNSTGSDNTAIGDGAMWTNQTGNRNTAIGRGAMVFGFDGDNNTALGTRALENTQGSNNTASGTYSMRNDTIGSNNTASGYQSLYNNINGNNNTTIGANSLYSNTTGFSNTSTGYQSMYSNINGVSNTANGNEALYANVLGNSNVAIGNQVLYNSTFGNQNTAIGARSLYGNVNGAGNVAAGFEALTANQTGTQNIAVGYQAGSNAGATFFNYHSFCIFMGANARAFGSASGAGGLLNSIAIGKLALVSADNQVRIGDNLISSIGGYAGWTNFSDGRYKKNVTDNVPGLDFILQLKPVTYNLDITGLNKHYNTQPDSTAELEKKRQQFIAQKEGQLQTGFIAQEVEAAATKLNYSFCGVDKPENTDGMYGLRYAEFVAPLVKAVQEQQQQIGELKKQNELLLKRLTALENKK
jgi:trimeric autotransporter adhesin